MKKLIGCLVVMTLLPVSFMVGCDKKMPTGPPDITSTLTVTTTPTGTLTPATSTATVTFTGTATSTGTLTPTTATATSTRTATSTATATFTETATSTATATFTGTLTPTTATATSTGTETSTTTATTTDTATNTATSTSTETSTETVTSTPTSTATVTATSSGPAVVDLKMAANFVVLAYSAITDSGPTTLCGDLGIAPLAAVSGGYVFTCGGAPHVTDSAAAQAKLDLSAAYDDAALRTPTTPVAGDLAGVTLSPGVYKSTSSLNISAPGLTLDALGDPNGVFIFQMVSTLITGPGSTVTLAGGAQAKNVFWQVGSTCALDTTTDFKGTIMAYGTIALNTGAMVQGRVLSKTDEVTMLTNNITMP